VQPQPPNAAAHVALRRFSAVWGASIAVKVAAIAVLLFLVGKLFGGI
jgi:hypothetical protein